MSQFKRSEVLSLRTKTHSIRWFLIAYIGFAAAMEIFAAVISDNIIYDVTNSSQNIFYCNTRLSDYYSSVQNMDLLVSDLVYENDPDVQKDFTNLKNTARTDVEWCITHTEGLLQKRFKRLENMLDYYVVPLDNFLQEKGRTAYSCYRELRYRAGLINTTSSMYYRYLSAYMDEKANQLKRQWTRKKYILMTVFGVYTVTWIMAALFFSRHIIRPLSAVIRGIKDLEQECYQFPSIPTSIEELGILNTAMQHLARKLQVHMETLQTNMRMEKELLQKENENLAMQNLVTEANLNNLQAQINPHFLFNTLSMISHSAYLSGNHDICDMMDHLAAVLRYALDKSNSLSTLFEEIEAVQNYFFIQKKRFGQRISFETDLAPDVPNVPIPAIILQPLVENSLLHGVKNMTENGEILIKIRKYQNRINIHVEDNGSGISPSQLEQIEAELYDSDHTNTEKSKTSIGLLNVYRRLSAYYGKDLRFSIESEEECGTVVTLNIPVLVLH